MDNVTDDKVSDESSHLHMFEDEDDQTTGKKLEETKASSILPDASAELKDDILDKYLNMKLEEKLLNDAGDDKEATVPSDKPASGLGKQEDEAKIMLLNSECDEDSRDDKASSISLDASAEPVDCKVDKFVNMENTILENGDEKLEEKLLNDAGDDKKATVPSDKPASDSRKQEEEAKITLLGSECDKDSKDDSSVNDKIPSVVNARENEVDSNNADSDKKTCVDSNDANKQKSGGDSDKCGAASDDSVNSANAEDNATEEKANAEILKDLIMATEDLLQIVDKDTEENNGNDSCSDNSPQSVGEDESDDTEMECNGTETEKVDHQEEESKTDKGAVEEDDGVDIEEDIPFRDEFDSELHKEYEKMAKDDENKSNEAKSSLTADTATAEAGADKNAVKAKYISLHETSANEDVAMEIAPCDEDVAMEIAPRDEDGNKKRDPKDDAISVTNDASRSGVTEECLSAEKEETTVEKDVEPATAKLVDAIRDAGAMDTSTKSSKRSLSDTSTASDSKKIKLQESHSDLAVPKNITIEGKDKKGKEATSECNVLAPCSQIVALSTVSEYMKNKKLKKVSRNDLEQICLMKMCEALGHKNEIGELQHQLDMQKQTVEMWKEEFMRLTKLEQNLQTVTKRLLREMRLKNERDKPLMPRKITRSVALQVDMDSNAISNVITLKRKINIPQVINTISPGKQNRCMENQTSINVPTEVVTTLSKIVTTVSNKVTTPTQAKVKMMPPKSPTSLLLQALQNAVAQAVTTIPTMTTVAAATPTTTVAASTTSDVSTATALTLTTSSTTFTVSIPTTSAMPVLTPTSIARKSIMNSSLKPMPKSAVNSNAFIDLADEDDKKRTTASTPTTTTVTASTAQSFRIVSVPIAVGNVVNTAGDVNCTRIMYAYNNQLHHGVLATDASKPGADKFMVRLNSNVIGQANGVYTSAPTGSTTAVSSTTLRDGQVQPVRLSNPATTVRNTTTMTQPVLKHPAPLPLPPASQVSLRACKPVPPKPHLSIRRSFGGVVVSWRMPYNLDNYESITRYQLYAYQETTSPPSSDMWRKVGDIKAIALPIACTLTQFVDGTKYHFAVRAVDLQKRIGPFSDPEQIFP